MSDRLTRLRRALLGPPADVNLPLSGAVPAAQKRAADDTIKTLQQMGKRLSDTTSHSYNWRQRAGLKRRTP